MLLFKKLEAFTLVSFEGRSFFLSERDVDCAFCQTAELFDDGHVGFAMISLCNETVVLSEADWHSLYAATEAHIQDSFEAFESSVGTVH